MKKVAPLRRCCRPRARSLGRRFRLLKACPHIYSDAHAKEPWIKRGHGLTCDSFGEKTCTSEEVLLLLTRGKKHLKGASSKSDASMASHNPGGGVSPVAGAEALAGAFDSGRLSTHILRTYTILLHLTFRDSKKYTRFCDDEHEKRRSHHLECDRSDKESCLIIEQVLPAADTQ